MALGTKKYLAIVLACMLGSGLWYGDGVRAQQEGAESLPQPLQDVLTDDVDILDDKDETLFDDFFDTFVEEDLEVLFEEDLDKDILDEDIEEKSLIPSVLNEELADDVMRDDALLKEDASSLMQE